MSDMSGLQLTEDELYRHVMEANDPGSSSNIPKLIKSLGTIQTAIQETPSGIPVRQLLVQARATFGRLIQSATNESIELRTAA